MNTHRQARSATRYWPFAALSACLLAGHAGAQQSDVPTPAMMLEEVVVTAQKRTEDLQRVPISIAVIAAAELEDRGTQNVRDLQYSVPNLTLYSQNDFNPNIIVRGIQSGARNIGFESALGTYVDGVFQGRTFAATQELEDIAQVEVLRGPQGTVFGKNTTVGAISITTTRPTDELRAKVALEGGDLSLRKASAMVSGPVVAGLVGAKLSGFSTERDGYYRNVSGQGPSRLLDQDTHGLRGELRITPLERLDIALRGDWSETDVTAMESEITRVLDNPLGVPVDSMVPGARTISVSGTRNENMRMISGGSITVDYELAGGSALTLISAYRNLDFDVAGIDIDGSSADYLSVDYYDELKQMSHELRLRSSDEGRLRYVVGVYYLDQDSHSDRHPRFGADLQQLFGIPPVDGLTVDTVGDITTRSYAAFANGSFSITDRLDLIAGVRYTKEEKEITVTQTVPPLGLAFPNIAQTRDELDDDDDVSPTIGLTYELTDDVFGYAKYSKGFKSGGWNAELLPVSDIAQVRFEPESIENVELGLRSDLWDRRMRVNATVFQQEYSDIQISTFVGGLVGYRTTNAAKATSRGGELELQVFPLPVLRIAVGVGYADAEYDRYPNGGGPGVDLDGERLDAPKWTMSGSALLTLPVSSGELTARLDYARRSSTPVSVLDENSGVPGFGVLDARVGFAFADAWEISLWCKNILDEDYLIERQTNTNLDLIGVRQLAGDYGEPRTWGLRVTYSH